MNSFKHFLLENKQHDLTEVVTTLRQNCSASFNEFINGGDNIIYRGASAGKLGVHDSTLIGRKSANTTNQYMELFGTNPLNSVWPKRSRSYICTTNKSYAGNFGEELYLVFPFNDVTIAAIVDGDMWMVEVNSYLGDKFNNFLLNYADLNPFIAALLGKRSIRESVTFTELQGVCGDLVIKLKQDPGFVTTLLDELTALENSYFAKDMGLTSSINEFDKSEHYQLMIDLLERLPQLYTFDEMGQHFKLFENVSKFTSYNFKGEQPEIWFSGKCVMIPVSMNDVILEIVND